MAATALIDRQPEEGFARVGDEAISVDQFAAEAAAFAGRLPDRSHVLNLCDDRYRFLVGFAAALIRGQITLLPVNRQPLTLRRTLEAYPDTTIVGDGPEAGFDAMLGVDRTPGKRSDAAWDCRIDLDSVCAIAFTSGSTGEPKPIFKHWGTLAQGAAINYRHLVGDLGPVSVVATVPPQHMYGLETTVMLPLLAPVTVTGERPLFPADVRRALARVSEPRVLVSTPVHLRSLVESGIELPRVARVLSATAPLPRAVARAVQDRLDADMLEVFGFSEAGCVATRRTASEEAFAPFEQFHFEQRTEGGWQVRAAHIPEPVALQDLLRFDREGRFELIGRSSDLINIAGKRGSLSELNRRLLEIDGVHDGVIFEPRNGSSERLAAMVVAPALTVSQIREKLRGYFDPVFLPRPLLLVDRLPRADSGKLPRDGLMAAFDAARKSEGR